MCTSVSDTDVISPVDTPMTKCRSSSVSRWPSPTNSAEIERFDASWAHTLACASKPISNPWKFT